MLRKALQYLSLTRWQWLLLLLQVGCHLYLLHGSTSSASKNIDSMQPGEQAWIRLYAPVVYLSLIFICAVCLLANIVYFVEGLRQAPHRSWRNAFFLCLLATSLAGYWFSIPHYIIRGLTDWRMTAEMALPNGKTYALLDSEFLQGQTIALAEKINENLLSKHYAVFGTTNGDSPCSYIKLLRPEYDSSNSSGLYLTSDSLLLGCRVSNACYLAQDLKHRRFYGHENVKQISPFVLLDAASAINSKDAIDQFNSLDAIAGRYSGPDDIPQINTFNDQKFSSNLMSTASQDRLSTFSSLPDTNELWSTATLQSGLIHPNPQVRQICRMLLDETSQTLATINRRRGALKTIIH